MSDLVRGASPPPAAPPRPPAPRAEPPAAEPPQAPSRPRPDPTSRVRLGELTTARPPEAGPRAADPGPAESRATRPSDTATGLFDELQLFLNGARELARSASFPWDALSRLVERVITSLANSDELFWLANGLLVANDRDYVAFHQARVCVLAVRIGANVGYERARLIELGVAGALIDVGLWPMPPAALRRLQALSPDEQTQYRTHPALGAEIIRRWAPPFDGIVEAVMHHHEREQGQGFPQGLAGSAIHPDAKILGLVDTYTALTTPASGPSGLRPNEAIREIVRGRNEAFPALLIKALLSEVSVFPPGTLVRLNTGETGRVVAVNRNHPLRPQVEIHDAKGQPAAPPKVIDLSEAPFLYITGPVGEGTR